MNNVKRIALGIVLVAFSAVAVMAAGISEPQATSESFPTKTITIVGAGNPGGANDAAARIAAEAARPHIGVPIVVETRAGSGGFVGAEYLVQQPADGYTLYSGTWGEFGWTMGQQLNPLPVGLWDLKPVFAVGAITASLAVPIDSPFQSVDELVAFAQANPGQLRWSAPGRGTAFWFPGIELSSVTGIQVTEVPSAGGAATLNLVGGGHVDYAFLATFLAAGVRDDRVRILAVWGEDRDPMAPDVPTLRELGYDLVVATPIKTIAVAKDVPDARVQALYEAISKGMDNPQVQEMIQAAGFAPLGWGPQEMTEHVRRQEADMARLAPAMKAILQ